MNHVRVLQSHEKGATLETHTSSLRSVRVEMSHPRKLVSTYWCLRGSGGVTYRDYYNRGLQGYIWGSYRGYYKDGLPYSRKDPVRFWAEGSLSPNPYKLHILRVSKAGIPFGRGFKDYCMLRTILNHFFKFSNKSQNPKPRLSRVREEQYSSQYKVKTSCCLRNCHSSGFPSMFPSAEADFRRE